jgi:hypothetical protein
VARSDVRVGPLTLPVGGRVVILHANEGGQAMLEGVGLHLLELVRPAR